MIERAFAHAAIQSRAIYRFYLAHFAISMRTDSATRDVTIYFENVNSII